MTKKPNLLMDTLKSEFLKSIHHLLVSYKKVKRLKTEVGVLSEDELEIWESFSSRFARSSDIFISKLLKAMILEKDPAFRGSVIDLLNEAEKFSIIEDAKTWKRIRELRNVAAHEYSSSNLSELYQEIRKLAPHILGLQKKFLCD